MSCVVYEWQGWALDALRGIEPYEVVQVLGAERRWPRPAKAPSGVDVLTVWARTRDGRPLIVAVRQVDRWDWTIIGARDMDPAEATEFARWEEATDD
jgi:hypothetical protein